MATTPKKAYVWRSGESAIGAASDHADPAGHLCLYCGRRSQVLSVQRVLPFSADVRLKSAACESCGPGPLREIDAALESALDRLAVDALRKNPLVLRAIAKVAFNYLACKHGREEALEARFDPIRAYIREGMGDGGGVRLADRSPRMPFKRIEGAHHVALVSRKTGLLGFGSFFGRLDFGVQLGSDLRQEDMTPRLTYWHYDTGRVEDVELQRLGLYFAAPA